MANLGYPSVLAPEHLRYWSWASTSFGLDALSVKRAVPSWQRPMLPRDVSHQLDPLLTWDQYFVSGLAYENRTDNMVYSQSRRLEQAYRTNINGILWRRVIRRYSGTADLNYVRYGRCQACRHSPDGGEVFVRCKRLVSPLPICACTSSKCQCASRDGCHQVGGRDCIANAKPRQRLESSKKWN